MSGALEHVDAAPELRAPFPWFGGKRRIAPLVWSRFGDVANYIEPFAGSLAVLLGRPTPPRVETVNDKDAYLANFWRAIQAAPDEVTHHAAWPVNEADLHARHRWLVTTGKERVDRLVTDPEFFDAKVAGWWVWGLSLWIGDGWCQRPEWRGRANAARDARGIHKRPEVKRPAIANGNGTGAGVHRGSLWKQKPDLSAGNGRGIIGKQRLTKKVPRSDRQRLATTAPPEGLAEYFAALSDRLCRVRVCVGDWSRVTGPAVTSCIGLTGILLDPPYHGLDDGGREKVYNHDDGEIWNEVKEWAIANGDNPLLRIALCGHEGEHGIPDTWECVAWKGPSGYARAENRIKNRERERVWFSPHCLDAAQQELAL